MGANVGEGGTFGKTEDDEVRVRLCEAYEARLPGTIEDRVWSGWV